MSNDLAGRNHGLLGKNGLWVGGRNQAVKLYDSAGNYVAGKFGKTWWVDTNVGHDSNNTGQSSNSPWLTMDKAFDQITAGNVKSGDTIAFRGNINETLTTPAGAADITIVGMGNRPRHADTHPLNGEVSGATWKIGSLSSAPLLTLRNPGWRIVNVLFAAHASNYAIKLERTADEDATEQDASHLEVIGCRFASGAGGINDAGGCFNVLVQNNRFQALTTACIIGVGNIGQGQTQWHILDNHFTGFTNGVKIAAFESIIRGNFFTDGGTPNTTYVLNTSNGGGGDNFIVHNYFQTATANFNTPDIVGNATDVWAMNVSIDSTSAGVGANHEWGQPA
jgi:hypothetical protein